MTENCRSMRLVGMSRMINRSPIARWSNSPHSVTITATLLWWKCLSMHLPSRCWSICVGFVLLSGPLRAAEPVNFTRHIQPILDKNCVSCHGPAKKKAGLRLDVGKRILAGSPGGPVVSAGKSSESKLLLKLRGQGEGDPMPPDGELTETEIQLIARWIDEGAVVPVNEKEIEIKHWAFELPKSSTVPAGIHPIDHFLELERSKRGLAAAPQADKATLLRRVFLDLTGLPPTPDQLNAFLTDQSPQAYEQWVNRLLDSPQYGERWGRHFLDLWRYSDWYGFGAELRNSQKHIWNWRDWVVESLNANKPYDQMIREMLAGDELEPANPSTVRATGYLARSYYKFNRNVWLDDIVEHTGKAFLGVTLNCCRCHDHMYDPLSQEEYFRFRAIFEPHQVRLDPVPGELDPEKRGVARVYDADAKAVTFLFERGDDKRPVKDKPLSPGVPRAISSRPFVAQEITLPPELAHPTLRESIWKVLIERAEKQLDQAKGTYRVRAATMNLQAVKAKLVADRARFGAPPAKHTQELIRHAVILQLEAAVLTAEADLAEARDALNALEANAKKDAKAVDAQKKKITDLTKVVDGARKACETPPSDYTALLSSYPERSTGRRLALANWIASYDNPLTARVLVNHVWLRHFGQPFVATVFDFGMNGRPPTHPDLLDSLALAFMYSNWDLKKLHRLMVTSMAYQMQSSMTGDVGDNNRKRDPDNLFFWRMTPRPLEAEAIRDSLLSVSKLLDPARGGPEMDFNEDAPKLRRSLYYRHAPEKMMPFLTVFDAPGHTECYRRANTVVPQQAMALVNCRLSTRAAEAVANDVKETTPERFVSTTFHRLLNREPTPAESDLCKEYLQKNSRASLVQALFNHADFTTIR
jgi:hypothetical protein